MSLFDSFCEDGNGKCHI